MGEDVINSYLHRRTVLGGIILFSGFRPALAKTKAKKTVIPSGRAAQVTSGHGFDLEDGRTVRLASIQAPRMAYENIRAEPLAVHARDALAELVINQDLHFSDPVPDKFSRVRAQAFAKADEDMPPLWIQGEMIRQGFARVHTWRDDHAHAADLLSLEAKARQARRNLWSNDYYAVRDPQSIGASIGSFQIVEGHIVDAAEVRGRVYLNFGANWRDDFTISIAPKDKKRFEKAGIALAGLSGARVRARGLVRQQNGPILYLDHPEALEILPT